MSQESGFTPARFHALLGESDWHVTSRGAEAIYRGDSLAQIAEPVPALVAAAEASAVAPDIDLRPTALAVRVGFDGDVLPAGVVQFARAVSAAAATLRAEPHAIQSIDVFVAQHEDADTRPFWAAVLGYVERGGTDAVDPLGRGPGIAVNPIGNGKRGRGRTHIDVHMSAETARARVDAALAAGGRLVDDAHAPAWWTLASPDNHGVDVAAWLDTWDGT